MDINKVIINRNKNIRQAMQAIDNASKKVLFIVDEDSKLIGSLSDGDIRRWILKNGSLDAGVDSIMNKNPITLNTKDLQKAMMIMRKKGITAIPIIQENRKIIDICFWAEEDLDCQKTINAKVVIMAGGKGERLMPYTSIVPKPLIPIGEKPIIELVIDSFKNYGCKEFFITVNYKKNMLKAYLEELDKDYKIKYVEEDKPLGTGGSLYFLKNDINSTFFVSNCDILLETDYADIMNFHRTSKNIITVVTSLKKYTVPYGVVNINSDGSINSLIEKPSADYLVNTGVYVVEPDVLNYLNDNEFMHITDLIAKCLRDNKRVGTYPISEDAWMDMGQFEDMEKMKKRLDR
ncbi:nucleotidyltransferase family protein [Anaerovorax odorimutans]|uniref:nucleotidyltransferase family protein n=1 Tax=Anaerovorax odorimutans TaxID=109327 RepID=UPI000428B803|nr:nucleotidyltransferase family protein [Anaerovorax odorimutans]